MLNSPGQYERAVREVDRLEKLIRAGTASEVDRRRYRDGTELCLIWEWAQEGRRMREANERSWARWDADQGRRSRAA